MLLWPGRVFLIFHLQMKTIGPSEASRQGHLWAARWAGPSCAVHRDPGISRPLGPRTQGHLPIPGFGQPGPQEACSLGSRGGLPLRAQEVLPRWGQTYRRAAVMVVLATIGANVY